MTRLRAVQLLRSIVITRNRLDRHIDQLKRASVMNEDLFAAINDLSGEARRLRFVASNLRDHGTPYQQGNLPE